MKMTFRKKMHFLIGGIELCYGHSQKKNSVVRIIGCTPYDLKCF